MSEAINRAAVDLARQAAGSSGFVVGDIGPSTADEPGAAAEQAGVLVDAGVDALVLETFRLEPAVAALAELRSIMGPVRGAADRQPLAMARRRRGRRAAAGRGRAPTWSDSTAGPRSATRCRLVRRLAGAVACPLLVKPGVARGRPRGGSDAGRLRRRRARRWSSTTSA